MKTSSLFQTFLILVLSLSLAETNRLIDLIQVTQFKKNQAPVSLEVARVSTLDQKLLPEIYVDSYEEGESPAGAAERPSVRPKKERFSHFQKIEVPVYVEED
ncbi:hypothetical protein K2X30_10725 [bacterium]|nr:hypothetical protein [bacterium]